MFFIFFLFVFLSFINFCVVDYVIWWSVFIVCTFVFIFMSKSSIGSLINYYVIQEVCGYYFLVFSSWKIQFLFLMLKSGSAPLHFWLFSVISGLNKWVFLWFFTIQKLPYFFVLINFCSEFFFFVLVIGMVFCYFHFFFFRGFVEMVSISSTESFNWLLLFSIFSFNDVFLFFFFYYFSMFFVISYVYSCGGFNFFNFEMLMIFLNVPLSITFFLKVILLFGSGNVVGFYYLFLLFFLTLMSVSLSYFFFFFSMNSLFSYSLKYYDYFVYLIFCVGLLSVF